MRSNILVNVQDNGRSFYIYQVKEKELVLEISSIDKPWYNETFNLGEDDVEQIVSALSNWIYVNNPYAERDE